MFERTTTLEETVKEKPAYDFLNAAMSYSSLKMIKRSIAHWIENKLHPKETAALFFGNAFHSFLLEPVKFHDKFVVNPFPDRRTKAYKQFADECRANNKLILSSEELNTLQGMKNAVIEHPTLPDLLNLEIFTATTMDGIQHKDYNLTGDFQVEHPVHFFYRGIKCKAFYDYVNFGRNIIIDLKTCSNASDDDIISKDMINYEYYIQEAFYKLAYLLSIKKNVVPEFYFVMIEKEPPYGISIRSLGKDWEEIAINVINRTIDKYKIFRANPELYKGYSPMIGNLEPPNWFKIKFI